MEKSNEPIVRLSESVEGIEMLEKYINLNQKRGRSEAQSMDSLKELYNLSDVMSLSVDNMHSALEALESRIAFEHKRNHVDESGKKLPKGQEYMEQGEWVYFGDGWVIKTRWQECLRRKIMRKNKDMKMVFVQGPEGMQFSPDAIISFLIGKVDRLIPFEEERAARVKSLSKKKQEEFDFAKVFKS